MGFRAVGFGGVGEPEGGNAFINEEIARRQRILQVEQFLRLSPPTFVGVDGPNATKDLLRRVEKIFELLECMP